MSFVVIQPHSNTNKSDDFLVVDHRDWNKYANGAVPSCAIAGRTKSYKEAEELRDSMNAAQRD